MWPHFHKMLPPDMPLRALHLQPQVVSDVLPVIKARCLLVLPSLVQALAANLGSTNDRVRTAAAAALDALAGVVEAPLLLGGLSSVVAGSGMRCKQVLLERLSSLAPQVGGATYYMR
jgi:hypothetical protein